MALSGHRRTPRWHHSRRRELLRAAMLLPHAAAGQPSKVGSKVASDSLLPPTECSLRSGCTVDERHGAGTHRSTLRERGRAGKLTWASPSVGKHGAAAPALVRARTLPSAARSATLLPARRLAVHTLLERLGRSSSELHGYSTRVAPAVTSQVCTTSTRTDGRVACTARRI